MDVWHWFRYDICVCGDCIWFLRCAVRHFTSCFKSRNALPPVYPAGTVVRRSITSCPVQRIPIEDGGLVGVGDPAFIFRRQPLTSCCRRLKIEAKGTVSQTQRATSTQKLNYLGEILAHELRTEARTRCESSAVPQDNPLDTRSTAGQSFGHAATNWHSKSYYRHVQGTICLLVFVQLWLSISMVFL